MASASDLTDKLTCHLCRERFQDPRKFPCCDHSFCTECISKYLNSVVISNNDVKFELICPVCRSALNPTHGNLADIREWVLSFPKDMKLTSWIEEIEVDGNKEKDKENVDICIVCKELGQISKSMSFCIECQEGLCVRCRDIHRVSKTSKHHKTVETITNANKQETNRELLIMISKYIACSEHQEKSIEFSCEDDDSLFCATCYILYHKNCNSVVDINEHISRSPDKEKSERLRKSFLELSKFSQEAIHAQQKSGIFGRKQTEIIDARLQDIRTHVVRLLDNLEENVKDHYKTKLKQTQFHESQFTETLNGIRNQLASKVAMIEYILTVGSDSQIYIALHKLEKEFIFFENLILEVCRSYKYNSIQLMESDFLSKFLSRNVDDTDNLVKLAYVESYVDFPRYNGKTIINFAVEKTETKSIKENNNAIYGPIYWCLLFVANNYFVVIDNRFGHCYLVDENLDIVASCNFMPNMSQEVDFRRIPFSATNLNDGVIAVSVPEEKKIYFVSYECMLKRAHVATRFKPKALYGLRDGDIAVAWDDPVAFGIISPQQIQQWIFPDRSVALEKVYFTEDKNGRQLSQFDYMAVDETRCHVVQSGTTDSAVYVFDFEGNPKFCYKNAELARPQGVAVDMSGNIYVCEETNSSIHIISSKGVELSIITNGCPSEPLAIGFMSNGKQFAVSHAGLGYAGREITFYKKILKK